MRVSLAWALQPLPELFGVQGHNCYPAEVKSAMYVRLIAHEIWEQTAPYDGSASLRLRLLSCLCILSSCACHLQSDNMSLHNVCTFKLKSDP